MFIIFSRHDKYVHLFLFYSTLIKLKLLSFTGDFQRRHRIGVSCRRARRLLTFGDFCCATLAPQAHLDEEILVCCSIL